MNKNKNKIVKRSKKPTGVFNRRLELSPQVSEAPENIFQTIDSAGFQKDTYSCRMIQNFTATTDGAGVYVVTVADNPSGDSNWASMAAAFDEYRTVAFKVNYTPLEFNGAAVIQAPMIGVIDLDTATNLTGYTLASQYSSVKENKGSNKWTRLVLMTGLENGDFISTGSPASRYYFKVYSSNNTVSTLIGRFDIEHLVQFRGKGI